MARSDDHTTVRDAVLFGGGGLLAYMLLRGFNGFGLGGGGGGRASDAPSTGSPTVAGSTSSVTTAETLPGEPCDVFMRTDGFKLNGQLTDRTTAIAACRAARAARPRFAGDVLQGDWDAFLRALLEAGVTFFVGDEFVLKNVETVRTSMIAAGRTVPPIWTLRTPWKGA